MNTAICLKIVGAFAVTAALALVPAPAMADDHGHHHAETYTCRGGDIPSGEYESILVKGMCTVAVGSVIKVEGSIMVAAGAMLDAQSASSTISVRHNVTAQQGSMLGLGCQPPAYTGNSAHECTVDPDGHSTITVGGNVTAYKADTVLLNGITVKGNVSLLGGGGMIPWSIKNDTIRGNLTVTGQTTTWLGVLFNKVKGNVTLLNIAINDEHPGAPGVYVVQNTVGRNLVCKGLTPGVSGGFVPGAVNVVGGHAIGQCASLV